MQLLRPLVVLPMHAEVQLEVLHCTAWVAVLPAPCSELSEVCSQTAGEAAGAEMLRDHVAVDKKKCDQILCDRILKCDQHVELEQCWASRVCPLVRLPSVAGCCHGL
jgi:hypothetical protein